LYSDTLKNINGCDSVVSLQLTVDTIVGQITKLPPDTLIMTGNGTITWLNCDSNQLVDGATSDTFVPNTSGTYAAIVTIGNCSDTTNCVSAVVNGIQEISNEQVRIYPNPTNNMLNIAFTSEAKYALSLHDMHGRTLFKVNGQGMFTSVDLSNYSSGLYILIVNLGEWTFQKKVVKTE
jgi:hypothetical protein